MYPPGTTDASPESTNVNVPQQASRVFAANTELLSSAPDGPSTARLNRVEKPPAACSALQQRVVERPTRFVRGRQNRDSQRDRLRRARTRDENEHEVGLVSLDRLTFDARVDLLVVEEGNRVRLVQNAIIGVQSDCAQTSGRHSKAPGPEPPGQSTT